MKHIYLLFIHLPFSRLPLCIIGTEHPHTVATRSAIGSTLAAQVLYQHKLVEVESGRSDQKSQQYVALNPQGVTQQQWRAADEHLRESLLTAIENPRGNQIQNQNQKNSKSKKNGKKQKKDNNMSRHSDGNNSSTKKIDITTLSAASAAQNLAVFLKSLAMTFDEDSSQRKQHLYEAKSFYDNVLKVRSELLPYDHPDLYATKYSLAELLEVLASSTRGSDDDENNNSNKDEKERHQEAADALRQEIIDTYDPPDLEEGGGEDTIDVQQVTTGVIVEKTVTSKKSY
jgi:hypothetical protein